MAGGSKGSATFVKVAVGDKGADFRPEQDYFSVALVALHVPAKGPWGAKKFAPMVWSSVKHIAMDGEKTLIGMYPPDTDEKRPKFDRKDLVTVVNLELTPRIIARERLTLDFTLGAVKEKDYVAGALKAASDIANSQAASFVSQIIPGAAAAIGIAKGGTQAATTVNATMNEMTGEDGLLTIGRFLQTMVSPIPSGLFAFVLDSEDVSGLKLVGNVLQNAKGPLKGAYAVVRLQCEATRPDWMILPDLTMAWNRIRDAVLNGGDVPAAIEHFRLTALTSPDLTREDADKLAKAAEQRFAAVRSGEEAAESAESLVSMESALGYFMTPPMESDDGHENAEIGGVPPHRQDGPFSRSLAMVLAHEGGYVDHPLDRGGPTNRGVTQKIYDAYRAKKALAAQPVQLITEDEWREIYYEGYWRPAQCVAMPSEAMAALMFDAAVNHGPRQAIRLLQQAASVPDAECDGVWRAQTRTRVTAAAAKAVALADACLTKREGFYRRIVELNPKQGAFLQGWMNRIASLRTYINPLLATAPLSVETESALFQQDDAWVYLRAAEPDFSGWNAGH